MAGLLAGVKVLESAVLIVGDYLGMLLADEGAEVIKVESPGTGDYIRDYMGEVVPHYSPFHLFMNRNKRSLTLDLRKEEGREVLYRLIEDADIFLTGNVADTPRKLGIDYATLGARKPELVYCQATGFGAEGPYATLPTHGQMMNALAAGVAVKMDPDGLAREDPMAQTPTSGAGAGVVLGPLFAAYGIAAALARRYRTGQGAYIDVSCTDATLAAAWMGVGSALNAARIKPVGMRAPDGEAARYGFYQAADGRFLLFCAQEHKFWDNFCRAVGREDLMATGDRTSPIDWGNDITLRHELQRIFATRSRDAWMRLFLEHDVAAGPVLDAAELEEDPHLRARAIVIETEHPAAGPFKMVGNPIRTAGERFMVRYPAPALGEHTEEILGEIGLGAEEIERLRERRVI
jgi:crotonobetainyl-CoA:carnitine CoA-transferase CaiB-like acyl-CoA transferase